MNSVAQQASRDKQDRLLKAEKAIKARSASARIEESFLDTHYNDIRKNVWVVTATDGTVLFQESVTPKRQAYWQTIGLTADGNLPKAASKKS